LLKIRAWRLRWLHSVNTGQITEKIDSRSQDGDSDDITPRLIANGTAPASYLPSGLSDSDGDILRGVKKLESVWNLVLRAAIV
jgi:hypothetical protein